MTFAVRIMPGHFTGKTNVHVASPDPATGLLQPIEDLVAAEFKLCRGSIHQPTRRRAISWPRQVAMYLAMESTHYSITDIARYWGVDKGTILHARKAVLAILATDSHLCGKVARLRDKVLAL